MADDVDTLVPLALWGIGPTEDGCTSHHLRARDITGPNPEIQRHNRTLHLDDTVPPHALARWRLDLMECFAQ